MKTNDWFKVYMFECPKCGEISEASDSDSLSDKERREEHDRVVEDYCDKCKTPIELV